MSHVLRLVLVTVLFAMLCIKASELCSAGSRSLAKGFMTDAGTAAHAGRDPEPLKSRALEFRGLLPLSASPWRERFIPPASNR